MTKSNIKDFNQQEFLETLPHGYIEKFEILSFSYALEKNNFVKWLKICIKVTKASVVVSFGFCFEVLEKVYKVRNGRGIERNLY